MIFILMRLPMFNKTELISAFHSNICRRHSSILSLEYKFDLKAKFRYGSNPPISGFKREFENTSTNTEHVQEQEAAQLVQPTFAFFWNLNNKSWILISLFNHGNIPSRYSSKFSSSSSFWSLAEANALSPERLMWSFTNWAKKKKVFPLTGRNIGERGKMQIQCGKLFCAIDSGYAQLFL